MMLPEEGLASDTRLQRRHVVDLVKRAEIVVDFCLIGGNLGILHAQQRATPSKENGTLQAHLVTEAREIPLRLREPPITSPNMLMSKLKYRTAAEPS